MKRLETRLRELEDKVDRRTTITAVVDCTDDGHFIYKGVKYANEEALREGLQEQGICHIIIDDL